MGASDVDYFHPRFAEALNEPGEIEIAGLTWPRHEVLKKMDREGFDEVFRQWVDGAKARSRERAHDFLREYGCLERFETMLHRKQNQNVIPFVGAGMSVRSGYPSWGPFLTSLVRTHPDAHGVVQELLTEAKYEEAAQAVEDALGRVALNEELHNRLGSHVRSQEAGPVCLLPDAFNAEVLTTNFDYVLPRIYQRAGNPFLQSFCGEALSTAPGRLGNAPHCLLRLHGEADTHDGRVLTLAEYIAAYHDSNRVSAILNAITGTRSLLFMGCSLKHDRTMSALVALRQSAVIEGARHYAFLPFPGEGEAVTRRGELLAAGIFPIYYPPEDHDQGIEDLLISLIEGGLE